MEIKKTETYIYNDIIVDNIKIGEIVYCPEKKELSRLDIYESHQNKGYGTEAVKQAIKEGYKTLWVRSDNPVAIHVYEKCGFVKSGESVFEMKVL